MVISLANAHRSAWRPPLTDPTQEILNQVFKAIPSRHRLDFLKEVFRSLNEEERKAVVEGTDISHPRSTQGTSPPPPATKMVPTPVLDSPTVQSPARPKPQTEPISDAQKKALVEAEFKKFAAQQPRQKEASMTKQVISFMGLLILGLGVLTGLAVMGREIYDWLRGLLGL